MEGTTNNSNNNNGNNNDNNQNNNNNNNSPSVPDTSRTMAPKGNPSQTSENAPPPAYTPRQIPDLPTLAAQTIRSRQQETMSRIFAQRPYATILSSATADDEHDEPTDPADNNPISLRITTSVNITRNNNLVCLPATPADHANAIAKAVVQAIQQNSSGQCGIPMIDENGCPRPLKIEVDAGMLVEGSGNVVGNEQVIAEVLRQRGSLRRTRDDAEEDDDEDIQDADGPSPSKRRRSE